MVKLVLACLALAMPHVALALNAQLDRKTLALGEPLTLSIAGKAASLEQLDLAPLKPEFEVFARTLSRSDAQGSLQLTLYPLRTGRLAIPSLGSGAERSRALSVHIQQSSELVPTVQFKLSTEPAQPMVRQPMRLTLEICDDGSLEWKRPALPLTSLAQHRALGEEQVEAEYDGQRCTAHRYHWAVLPTQAGEIALPLPMLEAGKFGQRLRLPPPTAAFNAIAAPAWLPLNVSIGKPIVSAAPLPSESPIERPLAWRFTVEGGYSIDGLKALLALHLQPHAAWRAYPPTVEALAPADRNSPLTHLAVTLYALPDASGTLNLPALALPYFDPASARLQQVALPRQQVQVYNPLWRKLGQAAAVLAGFILALAVTHFAHREIRWRQARRKALADVQAAASPAELASALRGLSWSADRRPAPSLGRWLTGMNAWACPNAPLAELVEAVAACHYGLRRTPLEELKQQARAVLGNIKPIRRYGRS